MKPGSSDKSGSTGLQPASILALAASLTLFFASTNPAVAQAPQDPRMAPPAAPAADPDLQGRLTRIDNMVNSQMTNLNIPAYNLAIIKNGQLVFCKAYGFADLQRRIPSSVDTVFGLASLTKTFTAITLLSLVDKGLIKLEDPLGKYIDGLTRPYQLLTIRQLASMTAGVPSKLSQEVLWKDQLEILDHTALQSEPGSQFLYSNFSYRLLGSVISNVTGKPFLEVVEETILAPLKMSSTATTVLLENTGRVAQGYGDNSGNGPLRPLEYKNPAISFSAGMLASTINDLINYVFGLMSRKILSEQAYRTMWLERPALTTGQPSKWAFGWASVTNPSFGGQRVISMNGGTQGVASTIIILPESNSAVIALCNLRKPPVYEIAKNAARMIFSDGSSTVTNQEEQFEGASE